MGCFLGCFGGSNSNKKLHKPSLIANSSHPRQNIGKQYSPVHQNVATKQESSEELIDPIILESRVKLEEKLSLTNQSKQEVQLSSGAQKRVTFDSNDKEYVHVSCSKAPEILDENETGPEFTRPSKSSSTRVRFDSNIKEYEHVSCDKAPEVLEKNEIGIQSTKPSKSSSTSDQSISTLSSEGSFPPNHRYGNCRYSDDEDADLDCVVSDLDNDDDESEAYDTEYSDDEYYLGQVPEISTRSCSSMESRTNNDHEVLNKEINTPPGFHRGARDRAGYVRSVLNPVENTAQWKNVKTKRTPPLNQQKEKSFLNSKSIEGPTKTYEVAVDASLSTWLNSSQKTPPKQTNLEPISSGGSVSSHGSNSVRLQEERPILCSHCRSPNEKPLLGTVGIHWDNRKDRTPITSASSFKGIPNTISKYKEDKSVKWHSTPFETRLERALNQGAADYRT